MNEHCNFTFTTQRAIQIHLARSPHCSPFCKIVDNKINHLRMITQQKEMQHYLLKEQAVLNNSNNLKTTSLKTTINHTTTDQFSQTFANTKTTGLEINNNHSRTQQSSEMFTPNFAWMSDADNDSTHFDFNNNQLSPHSTTNDSESNSSQSISEQSTSESNDSEDESDDDSQNSNSTTQHYTDRYNNEDNNNNIQLNNNPVNEFNPNLNETQFICGYNNNNITQQNFTSIKHQMEMIQNSVSLFKNKIGFLNENKQQIELLKLLSDANVPHELYQKINQWAKKAYLNGYKFDSQRTSRKAELRHLRKWLQLDSIVPEKIFVTLPGPSNDVVPVTRFDFCSQLLSLLTDHRLVGDLTKLDVNQDDPFSCYKSNDDLLSCFNSGQWYQDAYQNCCGEDPKNFLVPICFACDESKLSASGSTGCCPLLFSTTIFNQSLRNTSLVWRPLGYIFDLSNIESSAEKNNNQMI
jgi:hypothetical protein